MYPLPPRPLQWGEAVKMGGSGGEPWMGEAVWWPEAEKMGRDRERPQKATAAPPPCRVSVSLNAYECLWVCLCSRPSGQAEWG